MALLARSSVVAKPFAAGRSLAKAAGPRAICRAEPENKGTIHFGGQEFTEEQWENAKVGVLPRSPLRRPSHTHSTGPSRMLCTSMLWSMPRTSSRTCNPPRH